MPLTDAEKRERKLVKRRERYAQNKERISAERTEQRRLNPEKYLSQGRAWRENNRERFNEAQQARRAKNPDKCREWGRGNYQKNKAKRNASSKKYHVKNAEKLKVTAMEKYYANHEELKAYQRASAKKHSAQRKVYRKAHPEYSISAGHRRRAREYNSTVSDRAAIAKWEIKWRKAKSVRCYWCNLTFVGKVCVMDHIIPLSKTGPHSIDNVCISCRPCNSLKQASALDVWNSKIEQPVLL